MSIALRAGGADEHLGDKASALVDGALAPREHERLLGHVALCPACRAVVDGEREAKAFVARLAQPEMGVALTAALLTVPGAVNDDRVPLLAPVLEPLGASSRLPVALPATRAGRSSARAFAALSGVSATAAAVLIVGATAPATGLVAASGPAVPPTQQATLASAATVTPVGGGDPAGATAAWSMSDSSGRPVVRPAFSLVSGSDTPLRPAASSSRSFVVKGAPTPLMASARTAVSGLPTALTAAAAPAPSPPWVQPVALDPTAAASR